MTQQASSTDLYHVFSEDHGPSVTVRGAKKERPPEQGGVVDVAPLSQEHIYRISLKDDEICRRDDILAAPEVILVAAVASRFAHEPDKLMDQDPKLVDDVIAFLTGQVDEESAREREGNAGVDIWIDGGDECLVMVAEALNHRRIVPFRAVEVRGRTVLLPGCVLEKTTRTAESNRREPFVCPFEDDF